MPFSKFLHSEDGAVTVDWVVLTAALVGLAVATAGMVSEGVGTLGETTGETVAGVTVWGAPAAEE